MKIAKGLKVTTTPRQNYSHHPSNSCDSVRTYIAPEDLYEVKEVDRKLSYFLVEPSSIICDVGGESGIDAFPLAMRASLCVCLDTNRNAVRLGKLLSKRSIVLKAKVEFVIASATNLPFRNGSLDLVTCFSVLDHLPTKDDVCLALNEFSRAVKDFGYVAITFPNKLFVIGTISMKMKSLLDADAFFEQRFTPWEMRKIVILSGLTPIAFHSKYPTKIGATVLKHNLPSIVSKIPKSLTIPVFVIAESLFRRVERRSRLRLYGARFGYLSQKIPKGSCKEKSFMKT